MKAVHFGAGNIGRGFIGLLLDKAGYHTTFVDVNEQVIDEINLKKSYNVILADEAQKQERVTHITGINSTKNPEAVVDAIVHADIITTAVGATILPIIAKLIGKGLKERLKENKDSINVIACENMIGGSTLLKKHVLENMTDDEQKRINNQIGFPDAAVDRIVPNQSHEELLTVSVEPYYEWVVDQEAIKGTKPDIEGITYVSDLAPFIERKLFTVNTGHAVAAYLGYSMSFDTIKEVMDSSQVCPLVRGALEETGRVIVKQYGFDEKEHANYIEKIISRFQNPYISDHITRVARGPLRKLGKNDRLIRPATLYYDLFKEKPIYLAKAIAAALNYDYHEDQEAIELQKNISANGYKSALADIAEIDEKHPLIEAVIQQVNTL
ncbi:D-mannitol 1-phosphate 5-dehydrogenase [Pelagirhabdus alkalitolerans]|uniref:Mannitol-1-phosphate 5-dehydrogenase n=1 Tax=Pelagirhabdus alkalitolerans TaxID=1612202 RepID=A0A1G6JZR9_9BACI|nr:mannitol-1-phosphate 5-dehydrogenase [Pelagirhabdus alkalitolerans]SDC23885.1 D-mannitol 1-phosphate 5-dehydrogenase [Pelagirhabdus alkalitolerans]